MSSDHWFDRLPERLSERTRRPDASDRLTTPESSGEFVLYWMRTAARGHENPALDAAIAAANDLDIPAVVYHGLSERYEYASDRHHTFILEGARDVSRQLAQRGVGYALHVERPGHRGPHLKRLADRAAAVVTEDMPVPLLRDWTRTIHRETSPPLYLVDTDCVVPMRLVDDFHDRAYKFRRATQSMRQTRIDREWPNLEHDAGATLPDKLPFKPVEIEHASIEDLVGQCDINHGIGPVPHATGGHRAGYTRWNTFREQSLDVYHKRRNDPTDRSGVSRMSPYLHFGHVSPFRLAREAAEHDSKGADKYIDELITWRELAHHFAFHRPDDIGTVASLPDWAVETLRDHEDDPREALYDWETMARGETESELWNLCQQSLLAHGELHNNVRMTWAKKLLKWTPNVERALEVAIDLNHRYALDGRDPNSYLGIEWVFGAFDRPFDTDRDIIGRLRRRETDWHADRIDTDAYRSFVTQPASDRAPKVGVIGAGIAGLTAARTLRDHNLEVTVVDKGRGPGGRTATRHARTSDGSVDFDHGAQYFTARDTDFQRHVQAWRDQNVIDEWRPTLAVIDDDGTSLKDQTDGDTPRRFVGTPGMNQLARHLALPDATHYETEISRIAETGDRWTLESDDDSTSAPFDVVITTAPPIQSANLLRDASEQLADACRTVSMKPTWATMLRVGEPLPVDFDAAFVNTGPLSWIARNGSKPGRPNHHTWVLHADHAWSADHLESNANEITRRLLRAFSSAIDLAEPLTTDDIEYARAHRWRYAAPDPDDDAPPPGSLVDPDERLIACGDWTHGSRVEGAFLAGRHAAGRLLRSFYDAGTTDQLELLNDPN